MESKGEMRAVYKEKALKSLNQIEGIENVEIINVPDDVEADTGLKIRLKEG